MSDEPQIIDVTVTAPDAEWLAAHCRNLIEQRLAASANIIPAIQSIYRWQGEVHEGTEAYAILHTTADHFDEICRRTTEAQPYATPHVITIEVLAGNPRYLNWVVDGTG
jgi:periplasmic divalent cation tolerance protein